MKPRSEGPPRWSVLAIGVPVFALIALWLTSVLTVVVVVGIWAPIALRLWGPLVVGLGWGGVQASFAALVYWRVRRAPQPIRSWWSVAAAVFAFLLLPGNLTMVLLTLGSLSGRGIG
jgi:hypothetical protein